MTIPDAGGGFVPGTVPTPLAETTTPRQPAIADPDADPETVPGSTPTRMAVIDGQVHYRVLVVAVKIPEAQRDRIRPLLPDRAAVEHREFVPVLGADTPDGDRTFPAGSLEALDGARVAYELWATAQEITDLAGARNAVSVAVAPLVTAH